MRIAYFTSIGGWGGSEMYLKSLMLGVRDAGHDVTLVGIGGSRLFSEMQAAGVPCVAWRMGEPAPAEGAAPPARGQVRRASRGLKGALLAAMPTGVKLLAGSAQEARRLKAVLRACAPDVVQVTAHGYEMACVACRLAGIPSVVVYQTSPAAEPYWVRRLLMRWTPHACDRACYVSRFSAGAWAAVTGLKPERGAVVYNGIEMAPVRRARWRTDRAEPFRVLSIGRLHPMKGYRYLVEAMAALGSPSATLDVLGEGEEEAELKRLAERLGVGERVRFRGHVEDPGPFLAGADCFCLASVSMEGCPHVLAEAMAAGLPMVTSDFGPLPEMNRHGVTGLVVPAGDGAALGSALRRVMDDPGAAKRMGEAAQAAAPAYSRRSMVEAMLALYADVARRRGIPRA